MYWRQKLNFKCFATYCQSVPWRMKNKKWKMCNVMIGIEMKKEDEHICTTTIDFQPH